MSPIADLATTRTDWLADESRGRVAIGWVAVEGTCDDGSHVLYRGTGLSNEYRFFAPDGTFEEFFLATDAGGCASRMPGKCESAVVTRVLWGDRLALDDQIPMPPPERRGRRE